jgi:hypothetical protein
LMNCNAPPVPNAGGVMGTVAGVTGSTAASMPLITD